MSQHRMDVQLLGAGLLAGPLELDEQRPATWDEEHPVRPAGLPAHVELEAPHAELFKCADAGTALYVRLEGQNLQSPSLALL